MLEARELVQECITKGEQSAGYREFCGMAPGLPLLPESAGYRLYIESLFDELSTEVKVLFDRRDPSSVLWPKRATFEQLLEILNATELANVWGEDETIGWVYQFFNGQDERRKMREESQAPRNSRELAVRNQFFTPRYVVQFLTDNTLGRIWYEMRGTKTVLAERCEYMVRKPGEEFAPRAKKDPRDLRVLDPACGSGHFLLYAFDLLLAIYEEAYADPASPKSEATGKTLAEDYSSLDALKRAVPGLVLAHNLHGVDIDPRCAQIAQLALWMRATEGVPRFRIGAASARRSAARTSSSPSRWLPTTRSPRSSWRSWATPSSGACSRRSSSRSASRVTSVFLLRVEQLVARQADRGQTASLFAPPEERIRAALDRFISEEGSAASAARRFFVDDAAHGAALLRISGMRFDAILMNPPFGAPTESARPILEAIFPDSRYDLGAAFIEEGARRLASGGYLGAIFNRTNWFLSRLGRYRRTQLRAHWLPTNADLGLGVLDAFVETALTVVAQQPPRGKGVWFRLTDVEDKSVTLRSCIRAFAKSEEVQRCFQIDQLAFDASPTGAYSYWVPNALQTSSSRATLSSLGFEAKQGLATKDNFRFLRCHWEVASRTGAWHLYSKGGAYAPMAGTFHLVIDWSRAAQTAFENRDGQFCCLLTGQAHRYLFRPGVTYSQRTSRFSARVFPQGGLFDTKGSVVFAPGTLASSRHDDELLSLCLLLNTQIAQFIFDLSAGASDEGKARDYSQGMVSALPVPQDLVRAFSPLLPEARNVIADIIRLAATDPTSVYFAGLQAWHAGASDGIESAVATAKQTQARLDNVLRRASDIYAESIDLEPEARADIVASVQATHRQSEHDALSVSGEVMRARLRQAALIEAIAGPFDEDRRSLVAQCTHELLHDTPSARTRSFRVQNDYVEEPVKLAHEGAAPRVAHRTASCATGERPPPSASNSPRRRRWSRSCAPSSTR
jgi:hypothetical protein